MADDECPGIRAEAADLRAEVALLRGVVAALRGDRKPPQARHCPRRDLALAVTLGFAIGVIAVFVAARLL